MFVKKVQAFHEANPSPNLGFRLWNENNETGLSTGFLFCDLKIFVFFPVTTNQPVNIYDKAVMVALV